VRRGRAPRGRVLPGRWPLLTAPAGLAKPLGMPRRVLLPGLLLGVACATPPRAPASAAPQLVVPGARLFHEVDLTLPERGHETLLGALTFDGPDRLTLRAETPLGLRLFEVGYDGARCWAEVAPPLEGRFPALGLAEDVRRIYLAGCPGHEAPVARCAQGDLQIEERRAGDPVRVVQRILQDPGGRRTEIDYTDWAVTSGVLHPRRIELRSGPYRVQIFLTGLEGPG
jgi:hypothetical protein